MDIRNYFQKNTSRRTSNDADGSEQEAANYSFTSVGNISTEVNCHTGVNTHARSVSYGTNTALICSLCSLAAVATSPSMNVYFSVQFDISAYVSNRSEAVWCCSLYAAAPVAVLDINA